MFKKILKLSLLLFIILINTSCITKDLSQKGYIFDDDELSNIKVGLTNKENTLNYLGYPLNKSYFDEDIWIYYSYKIKEVLFFKPSLKEQKLLMLEFDKETNLIKNKLLYNINSNDYKILNTDMEYSQDKENVIKDILKNIGQISM